MGNSASHVAPDDSSAFPVVSPSASLSVTAGCSVRCSGWAVPRCVRSWSSSAAVFQKDILVPPPGPSQVRVKVYAASVNPFDTKRPTFGGSDSFSFGAALGPRVPHHAPVKFPFPYVMGTDGAGVVESVGWSPDDLSSAERFGLSVGDRVAFLAESGAFCQYVVLDASAVVPISSAALNFSAAAAVPCAAGTACVALFDRLRVESSQTIFINGASGGVGAVAVQLAKYAGLFVIAACSTKNIDFVKSLGADCVLDYTRVDVVAECCARTEGFGVDFALELSGAKSAGEIAGALRFGGGLCIVAQPLAIDADVLFQRQITVSHVFLGGFFAHTLTRGELRTVLETAMTLYEKGAFKMFVETVEVSRAHIVLDVVAKGHTRGKIALTDFHPEEPVEKESKEEEEAPNAPDKNTTERVQ